MDTSALTPCETVPHHSPLDREAAIEWMQKNLPKSRLSHVLRVETYAIELAKQHQLDVDCTAEAALLHDLAKYFEPQRILAMVMAEGIAVDSVAAADPRLLHADASAIVARDEFQRHDPEVLAAIQNHTLGQPQMSLISCAVFLADSLEPGRGTTMELKRMRRVSAENLHKGVWLVCDHTIQQLMQRKKSIHPRVVATRNWALSLSRNSSATKTPASK